MPNGIFENSFNKIFYRPDHKICPTAQLQFIILGLAKEINLNNFAPQG